MNKLQNLDYFPETFFVGALFPFVEDGALSMLVVQNRNKYKGGKIDTKLPGGSGMKEFSSDSKYYTKLEEVLEALTFDRRATLLIMNQEYSKKDTFKDHEESDDIMRLLRSLTIKCLEATGYYPADLDPFVIDVVERSDDHYQYFLEVKEWWDKNGDAVKIPEADEDFTPLDKDIVVARQTMSMMDDYEEILLDSHCRPVEFYLEHLRHLAMLKRKTDAQGED